MPHCIKAIQIIVTSLFILLTASSLSLAKTSATSLFQANAKRNFVSFGIGPTIGLSNAQSQFAMEQEIGWYPNRPGRGLLLSGVMQESFGNGTFRIDLSPRLAWDFKLSKSLGFYVRPYVQLGYSLLSSATTKHGFNLQFGLEPRISYENRALFFMRIFSIDMFVSSNIHARYALLFGGALTF